MDNSQIWKVMEEAWAALAERFEPVVEQTCKRYGFHRRDWGLLLAVRTFEPEETTPGHLMVRNPYTSVDAYMQRLHNAAQAGFLSETAPGRFGMTEKGRSITSNIADVARDAMAHADPLLPTDSGRLAYLMDRLVHACMSNPPPPDTWSIGLSYKLMPALNPPMPFIEQAFSCMAAYREDAHLAAWQRSGLSAMALEALTYFWRGEATSLDELCKKLEFRGHPFQIYNSVVGELREHGFITGPDSAPWVTGTGRVFRNEIEADTDRFFYAPWVGLSEEERMELMALLTRMRDGIR